MDLDFNPVYPRSGPYEVVIFDVRVPGATEAYWRLRAAAGEYTDVEMIDLDHPVLIIRPGGARRGRR